MTTLTNSPPTWCKPVAHSALISASNPVLAELHRKHRERQARLYPNPRPPRPRRHAKAIILSSEPFGPPALPAPKHPDILRRQLGRRIVDLVVEQYDVTREEILAPVIGRGRGSRRLAMPRQLIMLIMHERTNFSLAHIGRILHRDHTTVLHGIRKTRQRIASDPDTRAIYVAVNVCLNEVQP